MESLDTSIIFLLGGITGLVSICMAFYKEPLEFDESLYELRGSNYFIFSLLKYLE